MLTFRISITQVNTAVPPSHTVVLAGCVITVTLTAIATVHKHNCNDNK